MKLYLFSAFAICFLLTASPRASAADQRYYSVQMAVSVDGAKVLQPAAIVVADHPARFEVSGGKHPSYRVEYTVTAGDDEGANLDTQATVHVSFFNQVMGNWTLRAQPSLIAKLGEKASVELPYREGASSPRRVSVTMTVSRKTQDQMLALFNGKIPDVSMCPGSVDEHAGSSSSSVLKSTGLTAADCCTVKCKDVGMEGSSLTCCGVVSCNGCGSSCRP